MGVICIQSADLHNADAAGECKKQIFYILLGVPLMLGISFVDYRNWQRWAPALYVVNLLLLLFIMRGGHSALGAQRWISLGPLGTFQPSEPAKLVLAISLAAVFCRGSYDNLQDLWKPLLVVGIPALLILKQPDLGTALVSARDAHRAAILRAAQTRRFCDLYSRTAHRRRRRRGHERDSQAVSKVAPVRLSQSESRHARRRIQPQPVEDRGRQRAVARARAASRHADPVELRAGAFARFHLHGAGRRVGVCGRRRADGVVRRSAVRRSARDARRARPLRISCSRPGSSGCSSFTSWSTSA